MDKLESIQVFVAVARAGGFSAASRALGLPLATVSRKVAELEESLGVRLFERSTRQVLTDVAQPYFDSCNRLLDDMRDADEMVAGEHQAPKGELTITAPVGFGRKHLQPVALEFLRDFPQIDLGLLLVDHVVNLVEDHVDAALRISELPTAAWPHDPWDTSRWSWWLHRPTCNVPGNRFIRPTCPRTSASSGPASVPAGPGSSGWKVRRPCSRSACT